MLDNLSWYIRFALVMGQGNMILKSVASLECFVTIDTDMGQARDMGFSMRLNVLFSLSGFATLVAGPAISIVSDHGH